MQKNVEKEGRTLEEATMSALEALNATKEDVNVEVLNDGKAGFLGFGSKNARVRVTLKESSPAVSFEKQENEAGPEKTVPQEQSKEATGERMSEGEEQAVDPGLAKELLEGLLQRMHMDGTIEPKTREGRLHCNIIGKDSSLLIGKKGQTLESIQYLIKLMYSKSMKKKAYLVVDVEEYKIRREKKLQSIALEVSDKVKRTRKPIAIAPMNAQDRRIIHIALKNDDVVKTVSKGEGLMRKVIVVPK